MTNDTDGYTGLWAVSPMVCAICSAEWVAVYPVTAPALECDECGHMNQCPPLDTDDEEERDDAR